MTDGAVYSHVIEAAEYAFAASRRLCAQSDKLRDELNALLCTYRMHRFPHLAGASDTRTEDSVRQLLRDFLSRIEPPKSFVGFSRGGVCQACGDAIKHGAIEYDVVAGTSELRLDNDCYKVFLDESRAVASADSPDAA